MSQKTKEERKLYKREYRKKYQIRSIWHRLRSRAKERGHTCGISFDDFYAWCIETDYHLLRGRFADDASIDRIKNEIGYEKGNLQILTVGQNSKKELERRKDDDFKPMDIEDF